MTGKKNQLGKTSLPGSSNQPLTPLPHPHSPSESNPILCCGVSIVQHLFSLLYYFIW